MSVNAKIMSDKRSSFSIISAYYINMVSEKYLNPNAKPNSNFKKIPLNSKLWKDSSFDEVSIVIIYGDEVYVGTWESLENISSSEMEDEEFIPTSFGLIGAHKLSEDGKRWSRCGGNTGFVYTELESDYIEAIYTPKRDVDLTTAMELWLF